MRNLGSVLAAYLIGWGIFFLYFMSVARRISSLRDEVERLKKLMERNK